MRSASYLRGALSRLRLLFEDGHVHWSFVLDRTGKEPARALNELREIGPREKEVVEPGGGKIAVADTDPDLAAHPSPLAVALVVSEVDRGGVRVRIEDLAKDASPLSRDSMEPPQQTAA